MYQAEQLKNFSLPLPPTLKEFSCAPDKIFFDAKKYVPHVRKELKNLRESNKKILHKLQSREFSVAVVGLEKAGDTDIAEVYFYSREELLTSR